MNPAGYIVLEHGVRVDRTVGAYDRWIRRVPAQYRQSILLLDGTAPSMTEDDPACLGLVKYFHGLNAMAHEARKPVFNLRSADGAIGAHQHAVTSAHLFFEALSRKVLDRVGVSLQ